MSRLTATETGGICAKATAEAPARGSEGGKVAAGNSPRSCGSPVDLDLGTACPLGTCARHGVGQQLNTRTHDTATHGHTHACAGRDDEGGTPAGGGEAFLTGRRLAA